MDGLNDLTASFGNDAKTVSTEARKAVHKAAADTVRDAKIFAPVAKIAGGTLRNSIGSTITGNAFYSQAEIGPTAHYGRYVEEGTSRMAPRAYLGPAFDRNTPPFVSAMEAVLKKLQ